MVSDILVGYLLSTIICGDFKMQRDMWRNENAEDILRMEKESF
jgi:hypothetical protein